MENSGTIEMNVSLVDLCIEAATQSRDAVERWRRQRRTLEHMPSQLAESLLYRLLRRRLLFPSLLEVFKYSIEEIDLRGESSVDVEWMAYLGAFRYLHSLNVADCHRITSAALWSVAGMPSLTELNLSRCSKVTDAGIRHLLSIPTLEKLYISETGVTVNGVQLLSSLTYLSVLDLGGLPVTDAVLESLQGLTKLQHLDLWGSEISSQGAAVLSLFPKLSVLNLAWTKVTKLPSLSNLACLNMSNCTIDSIFEHDGKKANLEKLILSGALMMDVSEAFSRMETKFLSFLDLSNSSIQQFCFLPYMNALNHLDLSGSLMGDDSVEKIASIGANLRYLNLDRTKVSSFGVGILAGHVPRLESISFCCSLIDDLAITYIGTMQSLKHINLSKTKIKGLIRQLDAKQGSVPSLTALENLTFLEKLDMEEVNLIDSTLCPLSRFQELNDLTLRSGSLSDMSLHHLSSIPKLMNLRICDALLTDAGLNSFDPPPTLRILDLTGCWLLTKHGLLSFCKRQPQLEVKHELLPVLSSAEDGSNSLSPINAAFSSSPLKQKRKLPVLPLRPENAFLDQRLKYSREELLALQFSSISLVPSHDGGNLKPI